MSELGRGYSPRAGSWEVGTGRDQEEKPQSGAKKFKVHVALWRGPTFLARTESGKR